MAAFYEKKEADLSGRKNRPPRKGTGTPDRKGTPSSGERKPRTTAGKDKVNGNGTHDAGSKAETQKSEEADVEVVEKHVGETEEEPATTEE